jgi:hypothetical protein
MIILVDDEDRENEGDLVMAAQFADGPAIAFMARHGQRPDLPDPRGRSGRSPGPAADGRRQPH